MTIVKTALFGVFSLIMINTQACADSAAWHGVWVSAGHDCPTQAQLQSLENGPIPQGPHWQFTEAMFCEALRGEPQDGSAQIGMTGLCRSFGALESKSWIFERVNGGAAQVTGLGEGAVTMAACPRQETE